MNSSTSHSSSREPRGNYRTPILSGGSAKKLFLLFIVLIAAFYLFSSSAAAVQKSHDFEWFNSTWKYRQGFNVTSQISTDDWPIERNINFTELLAENGDTAKLDNNSIRVFEYDSNGNLLYQTRHQFDKGDNYNLSTNAHGELIFNINGTSSAGESRYFFVYFDSVDHGSKPATSFATNLSHNFDSEEINVTTEKFNYSIDTKRGDNTSGIYAAKDKANDQDVFDTKESNRTAEYIEYTNGTHKFTFNLSGNATFNSGPLRTIITQRGFQEFYNLSNESRKFKVTKKYFFYDLAGTPTSGFVKVKQTVENVDDSSKTIQSTPAGALALDLNRTMLGSEDRVTVTNQTDPVSNALVRGDFGVIFTGVANLNESLQDFLAISNQEEEKVRAGINLSSATLQPGETFSETAFVSPGTSSNTGTNEFRDMVDVFKSPPEVSAFDTETYNASINATTNLTVYNRGETVGLIGDMFSNLFNVTYTVNATLNNNTTTQSDDISVGLGFNGSDVWTGAFGLSDTSNTGLWSANLTAYTDDDIFLDYDTRQFNVTDIFFANLTIQNPVEVEGNPVFANLSVQNIRQDRNITGASVSCSYAGSNVDPSNITEFNSSSYPGLYTLNFTAPSPPGDYSLACNGTKLGNLGQDSIDFRSETATVLPNTTFDPSEVGLSNITQDQGENFTFSVNVSNTENGTSSDTNVSLTLPEGWNSNLSSSQCGDLAPDEYCVRSVEASVPNSTTPSNYSLNTTTEWINPDDSYNSSNSTLNVEVFENPVLKTPENFVNGSVGGGQEETIGKFTVNSLGNFNLSNVNFTCEYGGVCSEFNKSFDPVNVSNIGVGENSTVKVNVTPPKNATPGIYSGFVNITSDNSYDALNLTVDVINSTFVNTTSLDSEIKFDSITQLDNQTLGFQAQFNNTGEAFAFGVNASISIPSGWSSNATNATFGDLDSGDVVNSTFYLTAPEKTEPVNETVDITANWTDPEGDYNTSTDSITARVIANRKQNVTQTFINGSVLTGSYDTIGNITVESTGNANISEVNFTCVEGSGDVCRDFSVDFDPDNRSSLREGENFSSTFNVTVPTRYPNGEYEGKINVSSTAGSDTVDVNVSVPVTRRWTIDTRQEEGKSCLTNGDPRAGVLCTPILNNTGNADLNLSITPSSANLTEPNQTNLSLGFGETLEFNITYNVSSAPEDVHEATYNLSADSSAVPDWRYLNVTVLPVVKPFINVFPRTEVIAQNETVDLVANVTSQTDFNVTSANATVITPLNSSSNASMVRKNTIGNVSIWEIKYADNFTDPANTTIKGNYTINVSSKDGLGNEGYNTSEFLVEAKLFDSLQTLKQANDEDDQTYFPGDTGTVIYSLEDLNRSGVSDASVNFTLQSPELPASQRITSSGTTTFTTDSSGRPQLLPSFDLNDDFPIGVYYLFGNASWEDSDINRKMEIDSDTSFAIGREGGLDLKWGTGSVWHPGANFTAYAVTSSGGSLQNVDKINLTVLKPDGTTLFSFNSTDFSKEGTGVYTVSETIPSDADLGTHWSRLEVEDGSSRDIRYRSFRMATEEVATGPFDIRADLLNNTVQQGENIQFNLTLKNMGTVSGDSKVTYWVEGNGETYSYVTETIYTPANESLTIPRSLFIFENQPTGTYNLNAEVEPLDSSIEAAVANASFKVTKGEEQKEGGVETNVEEETETETVQEERPPVEGERPTTNLSIVDAPNTVNLATGGSSFKSVSIANTGDNELTNVSLVLIGLPSDWYSIEPSEVSSISVRDSRTFTVNFQLSEDSDIGTYNASFLATSSRDSDRRDLSVNVFESLEEKIGADIEALKSEAERLGEKMAELEAQGTDVSGLRSIIKQLNTTLRKAESDVAAGNTEKALQRISTSEKLIEEADNVIEKLRSQERALESAFRFLPVALGLVLLLAIILVIVYLVRVKSMHPLSAVREKFKGIKRYWKERREANRVQLKEDKKKALKLLDLIEAQHEEGIIDEDTYNELKNSAEEKLDRIKEQLGD